MVNGGFKRIKMGDQITQSAFHIGPNMLNQFAIEFGNERVPLM
jgi:hypothetical protein